MKSIDSFSSELMREIGKNLEDAQIGEPVTFQRTSQIMQRVLNGIQDPENLSVNFCNQGWTEAHY